MYYCPWENVSFFFTRNKCHLAWECQVSMVLTWQTQGWKRDEFAAKQIPVNTPDSIGAAL